MRRTKHFMAVILSLGMVMACSMVSFAAEPPAQNYMESVSVGSTVMGNKILTDYVNKHCKVIGDAVRLRSDPGFDGETIGYFYKTDDPWVHTTGEAASVGGETWLRVSDSSLGSAGWIAKSYVMVKHELHVSDNGFLN